MLLLKVGLCVGLLVMACGKFVSAELPRTFGQDLIFCLNELLKLQAGIRNPGAWSEIPYRLHFTLTPVEPFDFSKVKPKPPP